MEQKLDLKNTAIKFGLDQTFGALFNNSAFLVAIRLMRGGSIEDCVAALQNVSSAYLFNCALEDAVCFCVPKTAMPIRRLNFERMPLQTFANISATLC